ncbi:DUF3289 family protein [Erwinia sorbitola]|uniref:DUF3289 family protein n=1 Tax=Erwinia sorbitola TaxID=2681984 RepID=A0ABW9RDC6_9GAMM|nr:DUF3289 family protein [Erwinia sorbitola]
MARLQYPCVLFQSQRRMDDYNSRDMQYGDLTAQQLKTHFSLDTHDISKLKFKQFHFFRIWFLLQRYNKFGFKPFITNMEATFEVNGARNENEI